MPAPSEPRGMSWRVIKWGNQSSTQAAYPYCLSEPTTQAADPAAQATESVWRPTDDAQTQETTAEAPEPSQPASKSTKKPRALRTAPQPPPGQHAAYRMEADRYDYLSTHIWVAKFSPVGAICAGCRSRILADIRSSGKFVIPNFTRHIEEKCRMRRKIEDGKMPFPAPKEDEKPLSVDGRPGRVGMIFEVFEGGAPAPGTKWSTKTPEPEVQTMEVDVKDSVIPENKPPPQTAAPLSTQPAILPPIASQIPNLKVEHNSPASPLYSPLPALKLSPSPPSSFTPLHEKLGSVYHYDTPPPALSPADWDDSDSEEEIDELADDDDTCCSYSEPFTIRQKLSEERSTSSMDMDMS